MLSLIISNGRASTAVQIADEHAPALRSALQEIRNEIGGRLEGNHAFAKEGSLTSASIALAALAAGLNKIVKEGDEFYA